MPKDRCVRCGEDKSNQHTPVCDDCVQYLDAIQCLNEIHGVINDDNEALYDLIEKHVNAERGYREELAYSDERN